MALKHRIGKSQTLPFQITATGASQVVVIFSGKNRGEVYGRFSYPQRGDSNSTVDSSGETEWKNLDVDSTGNIFSGILSEEATMTVEDDVLICDVKAWNAIGDKTRIKRYEVLPIITTEVSNIAPV